MIKKRTLLRSSILILLVLLLIVGGNAKAFDQLTLYLPIVVDGTAETPSPTTPPPSTTEPPPATTEPPPTTEPPSGTTGKVVIRDIFYDGVLGTSEPDEYVEIRNDDTVSIQLQDWTLRDVANHVFTFPGFVMVPGKVCRVYTN